MTEEKYNKKYHSREGLEQKKRLDENYKTLSELEREVILKATREFYYY